MIQQNGEDFKRTLKLDITADQADLPSSGSGYLYYNGSVFSYDDLVFTETTYPGVISAGDDASKPTSPVVKDVYYALDTKRRYLCLSSGSWSYDQVFYDVDVEGDIAVSGAMVLGGALEVKSALSTLHSLKMLAGATINEISTDGTYPRQWKISPLP